MNAHNTANNDVVFAARLTPYRSLDQQGFFWLMVAVATVCFGVGFVFFLYGLWPVLGFMGFDVAIIYWAFKANYRSARCYEDVEISRAHVLLRKVNPEGVSKDHQFDQFGTRFNVERHEEIGIVKMTLQSRSKRVEFGSFLNPSDRENFAESFSRALWRAKR